MMSSYRERDRAQARGASEVQVAEEIMSTVRALERARRIAPTGTQYTVTRIWN